MSGFDCLGAVSPAAYIGANAAVSGQRAIAAGQKIAKTAPQLAAALIAAGQKTLSASKGAGQTPVPAPTKPLVAAPRSARSSVRPAPRRTHVGADPDPANPGFLTDGTPDPNAAAIADQWSQLADAGVAAADFVKSIQDRMNQLPPAVPLVAQGQSLINQYQLMFSQPIEDALSGTSAPTPSTVQGLIDAVQSFTDIRDHGPPGPLTNWFAKGRAYLRLHPPTQPADSGQPSS